jgi:hypothetical protein
LHQKQFDPHFVANSPSLDDRGVFVDDIA